MKETKKNLGRKIKLSRMERGLEVLANYMQKGFWGGKGIASRTVMMTPQRADNKTKKCKGVVCFTRKRSTNHRTPSDVKKPKTTCARALWRTEKKAKGTEHRTGWKPNEQERGAVYVIRAMKTKGGKRLRGGGGRECWEG